MDYATDLCIFRGTIHLIYVANHGSVLKAWQTGMDLALKDNSKSSLVADPSPMMCSICNISGISYNEFYESRQNRLCKECMQCYKYTRNKRASLPLMKSLITGASQSVYPAPYQCIISKDKKTIYKILYNYRISTPHISRRDYIAPFMTHWWGRSLLSPKSVAFLLLRFGNIYAALSHIIIADISFEIAKLTLYLSL